MNQIYIERMDALMTEKMKAAVFYGPRNIQINEIPVPKPNEDEVLIKVKYTGICGSDLHVYKGTSPEPMAPNPVLGHELGGEVVETGKNVTEFKPGDRVGVEPLIGCGRCAYCLEGKYHLCSKLQLIGMERQGGFAEYAVAPKDKAYILPDFITYQEAALLDSLAVGVHTINRAGVTLGSTAALFGCGTMGLLLLQLISLAGASRIIAVDLNDAHLVIARKVGATETINPVKTDPVQYILNATANGGGDFTFESVGGTAPTFSQSLKVVRKGGSMSFQGIFSENMPVSLWEILSKEVNILPAWSYARWGNISEYALALNIMASGKIITKQILSKEFSLLDISDAFEDALKGDSIKTLINCSIS
jgi:2-desacetyl-2-hydroxyethyl bacteriochlorophyllide A dehydrogenase